MLERVDDVDTEQDAEWPEHAVAAAYEAIRANPPIDWPEVAAQLEIDERIGDYAEVLACMLRAKQDRDGLHPVARAFIRQGTSVKHNPDINAIVAGLEYFGLIRAVTKNGRGPNAYWIAKSLLDTGPILAHLTGPNEPGDTSQTLIRSKVGRYWAVKI